MQVCRSTFAIVLGLSLNLVACYGGTPQTSQTTDDLDRIALADAGVVVVRDAVSPPGSDAGSGSGSGSGSDAGIPLPDGGDDTVCTVDEEPDLNDWLDAIDAGIADFSTTPDGAPTFIIFDPLPGDGTGSGSGAGSGSSTPIPVASTARLAPRQQPASPQTSLADAQAQLQAAQTVAAIRNQQAQTTQRLFNAGAASGAELDAAIMAQTVANADVAFWQSRVTFYTNVIAGNNAPNAAAQAAAQAAANAAQRAGLQARVTAAQAVLTNAQSYLGRIQRCRAAGAASLLELQNAQIAVANAQAALSVAQNALNAAP
ncbi:MAG TPA: hypothetical protein VFP84_20105 [Kofleriaceae bacterium]|nr:hypothetical protein [Kofleriaceae bacterium]